MALNSLVGENPSNFLFPGSSAISTIVGLTVARAPACTLQQFFHAFARPIPNVFSSTGPTRAHCPSRSAREGCLHSSCSPNHYEASAVGCHKVSDVFIGLRLHLGFRAPIGATALWHVHQGWAWPDRPPPGQPRSRCSWAVKLKTWCAAGLYNISLGFIGFRVGLGFGITLRLSIHPKLSICTCMILDTCAQ